MASILQTIFIHSEGVEAESIDRWLMDECGATTEHLAQYGAVEYLDHRQTYMVKVRDQAALEALSKYLIESNRGHPHFNAFVADEVMEEHGLTEHGLLTMCGEIGRWPSVGMGGHVVYFRDAKNGDTFIEKVLSRIDLGR